MTATAQTQNFDLRSQVSPLAVWIAVTHLMLPLLLSAVDHAALRNPGTWTGAAIFVIEVATLAMVAGAVGRSLSISGAVETSLVGLIIFLSVPVVAVTYLGSAGFLSLTNTMIATGGMEALLLFVAKPPATSPETTFAPGRPIPFFADRFTIALALLAFAVIALNILRYTPADSDSLWYHLPMVAEWIKTRSIAPIASVSLMARGYPGARESILVWLSLPLRSENVAVLSLLEIPATCMALYALCREFAIPHELSLALSALFLTAPEIALWATSQKNDLFLALAFLLLILFMRRWLDTRLPRYAVFAGLAAGLLCATKMSGPAYAIAIAGILAAALVLRERKKGMGSPLLSTAFAFFVAVAIAAPWYARNFVYFHNPVFPKLVMFRGKVLFPGWLDAAYFAPITMGFHFSRLAANWTQFFDGLGVALPFLLAAPVILLALFCARKRFAIDVEALLWLILLPAMLLGVYMIQPFSLLSRGVNSWEVQPRFLLPCAACLYVTLGVVLSRLGQRGAARAASFGIAAVSIANLLFWTHYWSALAILAAGAAAVAPFAARAIQGTPDSTLQMRRLAPVALASIVALTIPAAHWFDGFREQRKSSREYGYPGAISPGWGDVSVWIHRNVSGKRILFLGRPEDFPLYGRGFTNSLYTAENKDALPLAEQHAFDYVVGFRPFVRHGAQGEDWEYLPPATEALLAADPARFQLVYSQDGAQVLKVMK